jgi:hypothetical protein
MSPGRHWRPPALVFGQHWIAITRSAYSDVALNRTVRVAGTGAFPVQCRTTPEMSAETAASGAAADAVPHGMLCT